MRHNYCTIDNIIKVLFTKDITVDIDDISIINENIKNGYQKLSVI